MGVAAVVLIGLCAGVWWLRDTTDAAPPPVVEVSTPTAIVTESLPSIATRFTATPSAPTRSVAIAAPATAVAPAADWRIVCVADETSEPCPSARVWCVADLRSLIASEEASQCVVADVAAVVADRPPSGIADADGIALIPREDRCLLIATLEDRLGITIVDGPIDTATIRLAKKVPLAVDVVRANGEAAPSVAVLVSQVSRNALHRNARFMPPLVVRTNAQGRATIEDAAAWMIVASAADGENATLCISPEVIGGWKFGTRLDPSRFTGEPIRLQLPPVGPLDIRVCASPPGGLAGRVHIWIADPRDDAPDANLYEALYLQHRGGWIDRIAYDAPIVDGIAHFVDVPTNELIGIEVALLAWPARIPPQTWASQRTPNSLTTIDVVVECNVTDIEDTLRDMKLVRGRLLFDAAVAANDLIVTAWLDTDSPFPLVKDCPIDANGTFGFESLPGRASLRVTSSRSKSTLLKIDEFQIAPDGSTQPSIDPLDLRRKLVRIGARILDVNGRPVGGASISAAGGHQVTSETDGSFCLLATTPSVDVTILGVPGHAVLRRTIRDADVIHVGAR